MTAALRLIGAQLDSIDNALDTEGLEDLADMTWEPPTIDQTDNEDVARLLARIEESRRRLTEARAKTVAALAALEMKRQVARLYSGSPTTSPHP